MLPHIMDEETKTGVTNLCEIAKKVSDSIKILVQVTLKSELFPLHKNRV